MSGSNCCFLSCMQVSQDTGKVVWYSLLFKNFPQLFVIHTVKGFSIVSESEVCFKKKKFQCIVYDLMNTGNLISGSYAFPISSFYFWNFLVHVLLKPSLKDFEH